DQAVQHAMAEHARVGPRHVLVAETLLLEARRASPLRRYGPHEERGGALAEARRGGVVGHADAGMMAADVLGGEVVVEHAAQEDAPEGREVPLRPVPEAWRHDDGETP